MHIKKSDTPVNIYLFVKQYGFLVCKFINKSYFDCLSVGNSREIQSYITGHIGKTLYNKMLKAIFINV